MQNVKNHSECNTGECYNMIKGREEHKRRDREYGIRMRRRKKGGTKVIRWMVSQYSFSIGRTGAHLNA